MSQQLQSLRFLTGFDSSDFYIREMKSPVFGLVCTLKPFANKTPGECSLLSGSSEKLAVETLRSEVSVHYPQSVAEQTQGPQ